MAKKPSQRNGIDDQMVGVLLAGGTGSRLHPLTIHTNKHLIPVYMRPMIEYSLGTLLNMGFRKVLVITGREHMGQVVQLLGSGADYGEGVDFTFKVQERAGGIAQALALSRAFVAGRKVAVMLGDNIFDDPSINKRAEEFARDEGNHAMNFLTQVENPSSYGVAEVKNDRILAIAEKPKKPKSNLIVTGLYFYPNNVFEKAEKLKPSQRNELEITDINNAYAQEKALKFFNVKNWFDAGEPAPWMRTQTYVAEHPKSFPPERFRAR